MKLRLRFALLFATAVLSVAQTPPAPPPAPFQLPASPPDPAKPAAAPVAPDAVVVTVNGKAYKAKEMDELMKLLPPQGKAAIAQNPEPALTQLFVLYALAEDGKKRKLDEVSPVKEAIDSQARNYLANIAVQDENTHIKVTQTEQETYYESHKDQFESVKISAIYTAYTPNAKPGPDGKMPQTEAQAKAKAEALVKKLRAGANFAQVAKESSEDKESAGKGGEYATIRRSDSYPQPIKDVIFKLKDNEISDPVQQVPGFYIFKVTARNTQPFAEVQASLFEKAKQEKFDQWIKGIQKGIAPKIEKPEYFSGPKPPEPATPLAGTAIPVLPVGEASGIVATVSGKPYTAKEMDEYLRLLPPQPKAAMAKDPVAGLTQLFMIVQLSDEAKRRKLDQESPHKETLERITREGLANGVVAEHANGIAVTTEEQEAYYKAHQAQYEIAKVSAIKVAFAAPPQLNSDGKAPRSEDDAKAFAADLVKQLRAGADFAVLAKANSDDKDSAEKGGEYVTVRKTDAKVPVPMKTVVFNLKEGEVSDPMRQPGAFYIFMTTSKSVQPYSEVAAAIVQNVKQEKFNQWLSGLQAQYKPKIEKPEYFKK